MHSNCSLPSPWLCFLLHLLLIHIPRCFFVPFGAPSVCVCSPLLLWFGCGMSPKVHIFDHLVPRWWWCLGRLQTIWEVGLCLKRGLWRLGFEVYSFVPLPVPSLLLDLPRCEQTLTTTFASHSCKQVFPPMMDCISSNREPKSSFSPTYSLFSGHFYNSRGNSHIATMTGPQQTVKFLSDMRLSS